MLDQLHYRVYILTCIFSCKITPSFDCNMRVNKRLGHMGNLEFLISAFKESVANALGVSICLKDPIFGGKGKTATK